MLYRDLLIQAHHLASKEPKKPKDASLRRAVSTAYYSLFHLLIEEACKLFIPGRRKDLRHRMARNFEHKRMKEAAQEVTSGQSQAPPKLKSVAKAFVDLQQQRHDADYNLTKRFRRSGVLALLSQAEQALDDWETIRDLPAAETFLVSLLVKLR